MTTESNLEALLVEQLPLIDEVVRITARRRGMDGDEAEEFGATVRLALVENDYRVLRSFRGGSTLRTYLVTVVQRLALDFLIRKTGKWRSSAKARRLGPTAERLERLLCFERVSLDEACRTLCSDGETRESRDELAALAAALPVRHRPRRVPLDEAGREAESAETPWTELERSELERPVAARVRDVLREAFLDLAAEDRLLLKLRFESALPVSRIAALLGRDAKRLYKRTEWLAQGFRRALEQQGISLETLPELHDVARLLDLSAVLGEKEEPRPSTQPHGRGRGPREEESP